jgi:small-conductance mechanosensitive channel
MRDITPQTALPAILLQLPDPQAAAPDSLGPLAVLVRTLLREGGEPLELLANEAFLRVLGQVVSAFLILFVGFPLLFAVGRGVRGWVTRRYSAQRGLVAGKVVYYLGGIVLLLTFLGQVGIRLGPLLGAAGVVGIALGFASQTSVSNIISGFFLIAEQPFRVDDIIQVGNTTGRVLSIDMLSVKLRTFDNRFVRIPNETIVKSEVVTLTRFPIRRIDLMVGVAYREDLARVRAALLEVARDNRKVLMEPEPMVLFEGFGTSSVDFRFVAWATREDFVDARNSLADGVKARFDADGIEIPFPHVSVYAGSVTDPMPLRVVGEEDTGGEDGPRPPETGS